MKEQWIKKDRAWGAFPVGTKAKALLGGHWIKTKTGWKKGWNGRVVPKPGGDCIDMVCLPKQQSAVKP